MLHHTILCCTIPYHIKQSLEETTLREMEKEQVIKKSKENICFFLNRDEILSKLKHCKESLQVTEHFSKMFDINTKLMRT